MIEFLSRLLGIVLLRLGPQDLPAGWLPTGLSVLLYLAALALSMHWAGQPERPATFLLLAVVLPIGLARIVLALRRRPERTEQTLTALFGTAAILSLAALPLSASDARPPTAPLVLLSLFLFFWSFAVDAHIWRHALEVRFVTGLTVAVVLFAISLLTITALTGVP
ncbi:MAG: hypothetical protein HND55_14265 [Pseudomonadota bacterium]|nr:MAG: hypothetical protein HND55_14265 [Pseudomonadota bacterium]